MSSNVVTIMADKPLGHALTMMVEKRISFLVILSAEKSLAGVITERDIVNLMCGSGLKGKLVENVMTSPVITVNIKEDAFSAVNKFVSRGIRHLVVVNDAGKVKGVITLTNLMQLLGFEYFVDLKEVSEIMTRNAVSIDRKALLKDAIQLMARSGVSCIIATKEGEPVGILTERDFVKIGNRENTLETATVENVMSSPLVTTPENSNVLDTLSIMLKKNIRHMPVVSEKGKISGFVTQFDVTKGIELKYTAYLKEIIDDQKKALKHANEQLEERVKESTKDLVQINRQLQQEIENRKAIEAALRESEERYSLAQKLANVGSWDWNIETGSLEWSEQIEPLFGFKKGEFKRTFEAFLDCLHPDDRQFVTDSVNASVNEGKNYLVEHRIIWPDGSVKWMLESGDVMRDKKKRPIRMLGIVEDITDRKVAEEKLEESRQQLHNLALHLQNVREEERQGVARDIHDELGQILSVINLDLFWVKKRLGDDQGSLIKKIEGVSCLVDNAIDSVQKISSQLRTTVLDDLGLISAVEWLVQSFEERSEIKYNVILEPKEIDLCDKLSLALFRIVQEAMTNIVRHAEASQVDLNLSVGDDKIELIVRDDGTGIEKRHIHDPMSIGLIGMRERISPWKGELIISGEKGKGTEVFVSIPYKGRVN